MTVYKIVFYKRSKDHREPVSEYIDKQSLKDQEKILKYVEYLRQNDGYLEEPYAKHIRERIRELRVDFSNNRHRIFYFTFVAKKIVLLHAFTKRTVKTPPQEIKKALEYYNDVIANKESYEK